MRKRSGLLFGGMAAAVLLLVGLFLFWPAADSSAPAPSVNVQIEPGNDELAGVKAATRVAEKPVDKRETLGGEGGGGAAEPQEESDKPQIDTTVTADPSDETTAEKPANRKQGLSSGDNLLMLDGLVAGGKTNLLKASNESGKRQGERRPRRKKTVADHGRRLGSSLEPSSGPRLAEDMLNSFEFRSFGDTKGKRSKRKDLPKSLAKADRKRDANEARPTPKPKEKAEQKAGRKGNVADVADLRRPIAEAEGLELDYHSWRNEEANIWADEPAQPKRPERPDRAKTAPRTRMTDTKVDAKSTFSIDVDTGSYTLARARMREGYPPKKDDVRIEEFVNYFHYDYPEPVESEFAVAMEAAPDPLSSTPRRHLVRIGVQGKSVQTDERPPAHLTFLVDVSGSMFGPDQLGLVIEALDLVTRNLRPEDTIALVTFSTKADVLMWPAGATERDIISRTIATLSPGGSSALDKGLDLAYEVASTHFVAGHINRVVLLGDGRVNAGQTDPVTLLESVRFGVEDGVMLSTIGFGAKSFDDHMMEQLADRGNGAYYFVDSYREAQKVFGERLCGTLFTIAKDVKIQVEFNPKSVVRHRLLGYENRELKHEQFRNDAVDAGEIGAGHSVTAIYEVDLAEQLDETIASVSVRYKKPDEGSASELNFQLFTEELIADVREASADFKFAAAVAMYAEIARGTMPADEARMSLLREIAGEGVPRPAEQPDRAEFLALVDEAAMFFIN